MLNTQNPSWFPLFEFQDWIYQSYLTLPIPAEADAALGAAVTAKKWSRGTLESGQAFAADGGYTLTGTLQFRPGVKLSIVASGKLASEGEPATFKAVATGVDGPLAGMISTLVGWVTPEWPTVNGGGRVSTIGGSIRAVRGTDKAPEIGPSGVPLGTVGSFLIARAD